MTSTTPTTRPRRNLYAEHMASWALALQARGRSEGTILSYRRTVHRFAAYLDAQGHEMKASKTKATMVRDFLLERKIATSPGTAALDYRNLKAFFRWLVREDELKPGKNPMLKVDAVNVPEKDMPLLEPDQVKALLKTCKGSSFEDRRDRAIILTLADNGVRNSGLVGLRYTPDIPDTHDLRLEEGEILVTLKGGDRLRAPIGRTTAHAIDRYLRARREHKKSHLKALWLSPKGRLTDSGLRQMMARRGELAGVGHVYPHMFRHTAAHSLKSAGLTDEEIMAIFGWKSAVMARRYGRMLAGQRAREAFRRVAPSDALVG